MAASRHKDAGPHRTPSRSDDDPAGSDGIAHARVAIIGSGFGGLGTAIRLKQEGIDDFVVLERADSA